MKKWYGVAAGQLSGEEQVLPYMRVGARLKEEFLERRLADLGMTAQQAIAAGYRQVTRRECCNGAGFTMSRYDTGPYTGQPIVRLCPCFGLEQRAPEGSINEDIVAAEYERTARGELLTGLEDAAALLRAMREIPPPGWPG